MTSRAARITVLTALTVLVPSVALAAGDGDFDISKGLLAAYLGAFAAGFATSLTPCVYPMIPIILGVFGARGEKVTRMKALLLALAYVFGMGMTYASLGVVVSSLDIPFGSLLADPRFVIPIVLFYVVLAASMFGAFEMALPMSVQNRLNRVGGEGYGGAFAMGMVGGLTAAPCTGPFLLGILTFVGTSASSAALGGTILFTYALGMGVLVIALAVFALSVPKSGSWMEGVKSFGALALLGVGVYFLRPILPALRKATDPSLLFLVAGIGVALVGVVLGAIHLSFHGRMAVKLRKGAGVVLVLVGMTAVINWMMTPPAVLPWMHDEEAAFAAAKSDGKGVMIDFAAEWCNPCKELEVKTFSAFEVREAILDAYVPLKFDVTEGTDAQQALQDRYDAGTLPAVIFLDADGTERGRIVSAVSADEFLDRVRSLQAQASR